MVNIESLCMYWSFRACLLALKSDVICVCLLLSFGTQRRLLTFYTNEHHHQVIDHHLFSTMYEQLVHDAVITGMVLFEKLLAFRVYKFSCLDDSQ